MGKTSLSPVIAVVGPSGVGKDSVIAALAQLSPGLVPVRRVITRKPEAGGEAFESVTEGEFQNRLGTGEFALHWAAHGLHYGIPNQIDALRSDVTGVLVNLSRGVLMQAQMRFGDLTVLSLTADRDALQRRLAVRGREDVDDRNRRLDRASYPLPEGLKRVCVVENSGALEQTVQSAMSLLFPERS